MSYTEIITLLISIIALTISLLAAHYTKRQAEAAELQAAVALLPTEKELFSKMREFLTELSDQTISTLARSETFFSKEIAPINYGITGIRNSIQEGKDKILGFLKKYDELQYLIEETHEDQVGKHLRERSELINAAKAYSLQLISQMESERDRSKSK